MLTEFVPCPVDITKEVPAAAATRFRFKLHWTETDFLERNKTNVEFEAARTSGTVEKPTIKYSNSKKDVSGNSVEMLIKYRFFVTFGPSTRTPNGGFGGGKQGELLEEHDWQKFGEFSAQP